MNSVIHNLQHIQQAISVCCQQTHRQPNTVKLLAVSKTKPLEMIQTAYNAGQRAFGENYVQEAIEKIQQSQSLFNQNTEHSETLSSTPHMPIEWHLIGPLQSNKTKIVAEHFDWVQSVDRVKIAQRLNDQRPANMQNLNVCIQVNISQEANKSGATLEQAYELAAKIHKMPNLTLRGIMAIPTNTTDESILNALFNRLHTLYNELKATYATVDTLSMGMSQDMQTAIKNGSTMVRIGSAIFGQRQS